MKKLIIIYLFAFFYFEGYGQLKKGDIAPDFTLTNTVGDTVRLSDFKNKVVYIDFWASWCPPCLYEIPHAKKLKQEFEADTNIIFLYVSIDAKKEKWENMITKKELTGIQLISIGGEESDIKNKYEIVSIPKFVLINKEGVIADADAKRPSEKGIIKDIKKLLD